LWWKSSEARAEGRIYTNGRKKENNKEVGGAGVGQKKCDRN